MNKSDYVKIKDFFLSQDTIKRMNSQNQSGKMPATQRVNKGLVSSIQKKKKKKPKKQREKQANIKIGRGAWLEELGTLDLSVVESEPHVGCRDYLNKK